MPPGKHKMIILDEADSMTTGAQQALRRTMEIYSNTTRFCLACNQSNKIIDPIQSRCAILRYTNLSDEEVMRRLLQLCDIEKVEYTDSGLEALVFTAEGDMRQAINNLQSTFTGLGIVTADNVFKVCDQPHPITIRAILTACHQGDIEKAMEGLEQVWDDGYAAVDIIGTLFKVVKTMDSIPEAVKLEFIKVSCGRCTELSSLLSEIAFHHTTQALTAQLAHSTTPGNRMDTYAHSRRSVDGHPIGRLHGKIVQDGECVEPQPS